jgi:hypothetical protein
VTKERKEVIIALVPRIHPYDADYENFEQGELIRAQTTLYQGPLCYTDRPYESHLPDGKRVARPYIPTPAIRPRIDRQPCNYCEAPYPDYHVPRKPYPQERLLPEPPKPLIIGGDECYDPSLGQPADWSQADEDYSDEFTHDVGSYEELPEGNYEPADNSIISDQP